MSRFNRRSAPAVRHGLVQRKNRIAPTRSYWNEASREWVIDRQRPGKAFRHLLFCDEIRSFVELVPDFENLASGLRAVVLAPGSHRLDGWYSSGVIALCAWEREIERSVTLDYYREHGPQFELFGVPVEHCGGEVRCEFTEESAKAFQLVHVFLHELGHHVDRMTTRSRRRSARGESYAEGFARELERHVWPLYSIFAT